MDYCVQEMEKLCCWGRWQEAQGAVNREGQRDNKILFNNLSFQYCCVASCNNNAIFVGFSLISLESLGFF